MLGNDLFVLVIIMEFIWKLTHHLHYLFLTILIFAYLSL